MRKLYKIKCFGYLIVFCKEPLIQKQLIKFIKLL